MITRSYKAITARPIAILAVLLAAGLLFLMQDGLLQAQVASETFYHHEKDTGPVVTLSASDPERVTPIVWSLPTAAADPDGNGELVADDTQDNGDFKINASGELTFSASPNYETPIDEGTNNTYDVVVQASDGGMTTWVEYFKVTVTVLDVEEEGEVEWTVDPADTFGTEEDDQDLLEFQAGAALTATVEDPDGDATTTGGGVITDFAIDTVTWRWYRSSSMSSRGTVITATDGTPVDAAAYTVSDDADSNDVGMYLRAVATYTDRRGRNKTAEFVSPHRVRPAKVNQNSLPEFAPTSIEREVQEGPNGMVVGAPVTATDSDGDVRNYTLVGTDAGSFAIDQATGQITTNVELNYESPIDTGGDSADNIYVVTVHATDSAGGESSPDATVTITVLDVNEKPTFNAEDRTSASPANIEGMAADMAEEGVGNMWTAPYTVAAYTVSDPEGVMINAGKWSLAGDDAALFKLTGATDNVRNLEFIDKADFEMPMDSDKDNIYEVTVVASDGVEMAERAVTVKITDSDEAGMIALSSENPVTGTPIKATLEDSDGDVINVGWMWHVLDTADVSTDIDATNAISGATSDSYTPKAGDIGKHLVARAMYMDRTEDEDNDGTTPSDIANFIRFENMATSAVTAPVIDDPANAAPEFKEGDTAVRYVEEDSEVDRPVRDAETIGAPLEITDADGDADSHTFMLSGRDADSFDVNAGTGQLMTKPEMMLDYDGTKRSYTVVVTVEDGSGESNATDSITVTIQVKGLDEKPKIQGEENPQHYEKDTGPVVTLSASDPERVTPIVWSLPTAAADPDGNGELVADDTQDNGDFKINASGELTFSASPNYETPIDEGTNNTYDVVVQASDGGMTTWVEYFKVTVTVLDVEEEGEVEWTVDPADTFGTEEDDQDLLEFQAGAALTATVEDPDGDATTTGGGVITDFAIDTVTWRWYRSSSMSSRGTVITATDGTPVDAAAYTVSDDADSNDVGMYLRAVATYTDRRGSNKTAEFVSPHRVRPAKVNQNSLPEFALTEHSRRVQEGPKGMVVGAPVTATDSDGDVRNYTLVGTDAGSFAIDQATGQITTNVELNYESPIDTGGDSEDNIYVVTVHATDSAGGESSPDATVTITVLDVNEKPTFNAEDRTSASPANIEGMAADMAEEGVGNMWTAPYTVAAYTVSDPEGVMINAGKWSLAGDDAALFKLTGATDNVRNLEFIDKADFEMPMDSDKDNIYEVTVVASDGVEMAERAVTVKITDSDEAGMIALSSENPVTGTPIKATLEDSDGDVINVGWMWHVLDTAADVSTIAATNAISGATSDSYTPKAGDIGKHLVARAMYMDRTEDEDNTVSADTDVPGYMMIRFNNMATSAVTAPVIDDPANAAPEFKEGDTAVRYVEEDSEVDRPVRAAETIGAPLEITDADGMSATSHTFTLSGLDADSFDINAGTGQLMTKPDMMLNYETKRTYTVVVTVKDSSNESNATDSITVTIQVKDLDEKPVIQKGGLDISGRASVDYAENDTDAVATYMAAGPDAASATWSLEGADAGDFRLEGSGVSVMLKFKSSPDFESAADTDNTYMVTLKAADGTYTDTYEVTVMVTNVDELGTLDGPDSVDNYMENSTSTVATYTADGPVSATWTLSGDDASDFTITGGVLAFSSASGPNFEMPMGGADGNSNTYRVTVQAAAGGETDEVPVTVTVTNVEELGTVSGDPDPIPDYPENGTSTVATYTTDGPVDAMWSLEGADAGAFSISQDGVLTFTSSPNYENPADADTDNTYMVTVKAEAGGESDMATVTINVTDMSEAPMFAADMDTRSVAENTAAGENVGDPVMAIDEDEGDTLTYALSGDDAASFAIDAATGQIMVGEGTVLDFESEKTTYTVTVTATAGDGLSDMVTVTITVTNVNDQMPMFADEMAEFSVDENAAAGTVVGMVMAADDADSLMYSDDSMYFDVSETGQIMVAEGAMLDYEMDPMHTFTITASDGEDMDSITVTVTVTDMYPGCGTQGGDAANMYLNNDCEALLDSKDALGGSLNWSEALRINRWNGIQGHAMFPSLSGDPMRVTALHLQKKGLDGEIPDALGRLSGLTYLNLHSNELQGMVPGALGSLSNLEELYLNNNELTGSIPAELGGLSSLTTLWLKSNQLTNGIPPELGSLSNLMNLRLFNNVDLGGTIPMELGSLSNLTHLVVQDTGLTGSIPTELGNLSNLVWLGLYNNELSGGIPMELGSLSNLEVLYLHNNMLSGSVPEELGNLSMLTNLWLKRNQLDGEIPASLGMLANLERVRINMNNFTGCVPAGLTDSAGIDSDAELLTHLDTCP